MLTSTQQQDLPHSRKPRQVHVPVGLPGPQGRSGGELQAHPEVQPAVGEGEVPDGVHGTIRGAGADAAEGVRVHESLPIEGLRHEDPR